jgi:hypothetical protein
VLLWVPGLGVCGLRAPGWAASAGVTAVR